MSITGPAAGWFDTAMLPDGDFSVVPDRSGRVVLVCVDGFLEPTVAERDLICAVSSAVGRCVVVAVPEIGGRWEEEVPPRIPVVAGSDPTLPEVVNRVADAAADPVSPSPADQRRALLSRCLGEEKEFRTRLVEQEHRRWNAARGDAVIEALNSVAPAPGKMNVRDLEASSRDAAESLRSALDLDAVPPCPDPEPVPRSRDIMDLVVGMLAFGAAFGIARELVPLAVALVLAAVLVAAVVGARLRHRRHSVRTRWAAAHVARLRRAWERELREVEPPRPDIRGWRLDFLSVESGMAERKTRKIERGNA